MQMCFLPKPWSKLIRRAVVAESRKIDSVYVDRSRPVRIPRLENVQVFVYIKINIDLYIKESMIYTFYICYIIFSIILELLFINFQLYLF